MIHLGSTEFFTKNYGVISHNNPDLLLRAAYVWVLFEEQKNIDKSKERTQKLSEDPNLCLVLCLGWAVQKILKFVPGVNDSTPLCSIYCHLAYRSNFITNMYTLQLLWTNCALGGGKKIFGFNKYNIGNKNIQYREVMIFLLKRCSSDKIMILG